jgi:UDP:flavonoid glycosyltransferase YjiC (YdhE family)
MWAPGAGKTIIKNETRFDAVIEPGELAGAFDRGLTRSHAGRPHFVPPIRFLRDGEALSRRAARAELGIDEAETAVLLQLGSGNNWQSGAPLGHAISRLAALPGTRVFHADWIITDGTTELPDGVERLSRFPYAMILAAFDFAIASAGYNTFHENIAAALPTVFVPNENPEQDQQVLRAQHAMVSGTGLMARASVPQEIGRAMTHILTPETRAAISARCRRLPRTNGADAAAAFATEIAMTRKPFRGGL